MPPRAHHGTTQPPADPALAQVSDLAAEVAEREDAITAAVLSGAMISDARKRFGYHTLQREGS
jgi:hypothetical protein